jgi:putative membrane protein
MGQMGLLVRFLASAVAVVAAAKWIPGIEVDSWGTAFMAALVLGLINLIVRPLVMLLTLPINLLTLGLFSLVINAIMFWLTGVLVDGLEVSGFVPAFLGALLVAVVTWVADKFVD